MKIAVITGAGQGIGLAIAQRVNRDGYHVVALDRVAETAERTAELVGGTACVADVSRDESLGQCAAMLRDTFGSVDVLVNNAGYWRQETFEEGTEDGARDIFDVNVLGAWRVVRHLLPLFNPGGAIVNVTSIAVSCPPFDLGLYPATKAALLGLTRQLAVQLGPRGIRVNAVAPGLIRTAGSQKAYEDGGRDRLLATLPIPRAGEPEDIADVVSFLVGHDSRYITGEEIRVDGGFLLVGATDRGA
ncbi:SDR family oxidoreductase [Aeromicrobium sp.]|uniref:SDR family NAD(P)-dependent oxidoreductase n=1 Tax=Aeromicrobium sp. TaxID=1871063 RepID=UPI0019C93BD7|nr:SDR family oxidoreductase [Aeromicrobium sp.]MBC7632249.1 SDR family oxidoreductase [Aeromicrobium sp.]